MCRHVTTIQVALKVRIQAVNYRLNPKPSATAQGKALVAVAMVTVDILNPDTVPKDNLVTAAPSEKDPIIMLSFTFSQINGLQECF